MSLFLFFVSAQAAEGRMEFGFGSGFGAATPAIANDGDLQAFAFLPGRHFSIKAGGSARINEHFEVGGVGYVDFPDYAILWPDRRYSRGQSAAYQIGPMLRVKQDWAHFGVYAGTVPGVAVYSNFTSGNSATGRWTDTITLVPALDGHAGVTIQGFGEYAFFIEGASTWQPVSNTEEEAALFQLAATHSPGEAEILEDPDSVKWRLTVGVHIHGR